MWQEGIVSNLQLLDTSLIYSIVVTTVAITDNRNLLNCDFKNKNNLIPIAIC